MSLKHIRLSLQQWANGVAGLHQSLPIQWQVLLLFGLGAAPLLLWMSSRRRELKSCHGVTPSDRGEEYFKKHSQNKPYHVPSTGFTYPSIRTFFRQHPQADKLPSKPLPLPLLVFIHGLGGSATQFSPLLSSLVNAGPCLCIDLPGCGQSKFAPLDWEAYTTHALVQLLAVVIESYRDVENAQGIVFVGHSMGCSLSALLASTVSQDVGEIPDRTVGLVAMCPVARGLSEENESKLRKLLRIPALLFDMLRKWDRKGGVDSRSVHRIVGVDAETETKNLALLFNEQSKTAVWQRMSRGLLPRRDGDSTDGGLPGEETWAGLDVPVFLIAGESDTVAVPENIHEIAQFLETAWARSPRKDPLGETDNRVSGRRPSISQLKPARALKTTILPAPASHGLLFAPSTCRIISGLIQSFLAEHVDKRLSLGWQLQYLSTEGKWDVKNLAKWQAVDPISEPIGGIFRAMKTMREVDDIHSPKIFVKRWAGQISAVVDISHESPVYDPSSLDKGGIEYHKFPTVSKLPPTAEEVNTFNALIDRLRASQPQTQPLPLGPNANPAATSNAQKQNQKPLIAVHCHYGFNRTGFFIICYLVDREGWRLQDAIDEFARRRPPGVRHDYFVDTLFVRYCKGLKRAPTV